MDTDVRLYSEPSPAASLNPSLLFAGLSGDTSSLGSSTSTAVLKFVETSDSDDCECTGVALRLLEVAMVPLEPADYQSVANKLNLLKKHISQCSSLWKCPSCIEDSGYAMLVLVVCEKLATTFEGLAHCLGKGTRSLGLTSNCNNIPSRRGTSRTADLKLDTKGSSAQQQEQHQRLLENTCSQEQPDVSALGHYEIDTPEEQKAVLATLISLQLQRLLALLAEMRSSATKFGWNAHLSHIVALIDRGRRTSDMTRS
jgi:hypothetical protein